MGTRRLLAPPVLLALSWLFSALASCRPGATDRAPWTPGITYETPRAASKRGLLDRRGLIHAHSVYSHDACDGQPVVDGVRDQVCFEDFRRGLCQSKHDFVMLTDHRDAFSSTPYPDVLLHRPERGDVLIDRGQGPVASWARCPDGTVALVLAGAEAGIMPVGLEGHASTDESVRDQLYRSRSAEAIEQLKSLGAVALVAHTEDWTIDELVDLPIEGFEMFNFHANALLRGGNALELLIRLDRGDSGLPHPDLMFLGIISEDPRYLALWGSALARGARRTTTMGTDCHRNTFQATAQDGERIDSYRRAMIAFSNHLLVRAESDGSWDDRHLKEALRRGRLYGAFEALGYPQGFDYRADSDRGVSEMGDEIPLSDHPTLVVTSPEVEAIDPDREPPVIRARILRAIEGGFEEVASGEREARLRPTEGGAYRAEVRIVPRHLAADLGEYAASLLAGDFVWIYSNPIYVR